MKTFQFKFIEKKNFFYTLSTLLIITGFTLMALRGLKAEPVLNWGIDFVGGSTLNLKFPTLEAQLAQADQKQQSRQDITTQFIERIRTSLTQLSLEKSSIQITPEDEILIKTNSLDTAALKKIQAQLQKDFGSIETLEVDFIGPSIGQELRNKSIWIILTVCTSLLLFISWRFTFSYGIAAIAALFHDALATLSIASIFFIEVDTGFIAAMLTVLGYSMNDTIIIFDRIRENLVQRKTTQSIMNITNLSLNQTLTRTINTVLTALIMLIAMIIFGGNTIRSFLVVLFIGIALGTYSSLFIASPVFVYFSNKKEAANPPEKVTVKK